jgi:WxL Interacting Protein, peptidoglycan binding domain
LKSKLVSALSMLLIFNVVVAASLSLLSLGVASSPASAATNGRYSIFPASIAGSSEPQRIFFNYLVNPGTSVPDAVTVTNQTTETLPFQLMPADAVNTPRNGGFALNSTAKHLRSVGAWIRLSTLTVTLPPHTLANIPFSVDVPPGLTPGDYAGGIILQPPAVPEQRGNVTVDLYEDVGARVYVRVRGPLNPRLSVTQLSVNTSGFAGNVGGPVSPTVTYTLTNTGNQILNPTAKLSVSPLLGSGLNIPQRQYPSLLPHNSVNVTYKLTSREAFLQLNADLSVKSAAGTTTASTTAWIIPWILVAVIVLLLALFWFFRRRRRRRAVPATPPAEPEPAAATSSV